MGHLSRESHSLPRAVLILAAATVVAGCGAFFNVTDPDPPEPRSFQLAVPAFGRPAGVPVVVIDSTESVAGAEVDGRDPPIGRFGDTFFKPVPDRLDAVIVGWSGGCEDRVDIAVESGVGISITLKRTWKAVECAPRDAPRSVILHFEHPIDATKMQLHLVD